MPSIQFLKVVHAQEQETAQNISIKYASRVACDVWNNPCSLTETLQYETAICSIIIFFVHEHTFFKISVKKLFFSKR